MDRDEIEPSEAIGPGRPAKNLMDPAFFDPFIEYLNEGMSFKEACALSGISHTTVRKWVRAGQHDLNAGRDSAMAEFSLAVTQAMAEAKHLRIQALNNAAAIPAFWAAAAWWLERRYPTEFGRQDRMDMKMSGQLQLAQAANIELTEDELNGLRSVFGKLGVSQAEDGEGESVGFGSDSENELFSLP